MVRGSCRLQYFNITKNIRINDMNKKELTDLVAKIYNKVEDLESTIREAENEVKIILRELENIPDDPEDIEDDEDDEDEEIDIPNTIDED
jgi:seryl-tRNA synthetase